MFKTNIHSFLNRAWIALIICLAPVQAEAQDYKKQYKNAKEFFTEASNLSWLAVLEKSPGNIKNP